MIYLSYPSECNLLNSKIYLNKLIDDYYSKSQNYRSKFVYNNLSNRDAYKNIRLNIENKKTESPFMKISFPKAIHIEDSDLEKKTNRLIELKINKLIQEQYIIWKGFDETSINGLYEVSLNCNGLLSIVFEHYSYGYGTNHGVTSLKSLNLDIFTGNEFTLSDLFNNNSPYKHRLNTFIKNEISLKDPPILYRIPKITENQGFYLNKNHLIVYYPVGEYTSTNYGLLKFEIPLSLLIDLINIKGPLGRLIT